MAFELGHSVSEEVRNKIREKAKLRIGQKNSFYGKHHSDKTKEILRKKNIGKHLTDVVKQKISISLMGDRNPFYGKKHSEESIRKLSLARINRPLKEHICVRCGKKYLTNTYNRIYCDNCIKIVDKENMRKTDVKRRNRPERRIQIIISKRKYNHSVHGRQVNRDWRRLTERGKWNTKYNNLRRGERHRHTDRGYTKAEWCSIIMKAKEDGYCPKCKEKYTTGRLSKHEITIDHNPPLKIAEKQFFETGKRFIYLKENLRPLCLACNTSENQYSERFKKPIISNISLH